MFQAQSPEVMEKLQQIAETCVDKTGLDFDLLMKLNQGQYTGDGSDLECYPKCFLLNANIMSDQGKLDFDPLREFLKNEKHIDKINIILDKCQEEKGKDNCETAFLIYKCFFNGALEHKVFD